MGRLGQEGKLRSDFDGYGFQIGVLGVYFLGFYRWEGEIKYLEGKYK